MRIISYIFSVFIDAKRARLITVGDFYAYAEPIQNPCRHNFLIPEPREQQVVLYTYWLSNYKLLQLLARLLASYTYLFHLWQR